MVNFKILKIIIFFSSFLLLLFLVPLKTAAQELSITYYLSGNDMQTIYLPGPSKVHKVNILACSVQNRNGGFQVDIALFAQGIQVAYQGTLGFGRSGCPMWSYAGTPDGTALDFGGTSADAIRIIPIVGTGSYYQMYVTYEEGYIPPVIQCGASNTIAEYFNYGGGNFVLPALVKVHKVNFYACSVQNRNGGFNLGVALYRSGVQVAYIGHLWDQRLGYARSGCPMWSFAQSPAVSAKNFGGVVADTIKAVNLWGGGGIYRIYYTHEPEQCSRAATAVATISTDGLNYGPSVTVGRGVPTSIYLSAAGSSHPDGWDKVLNGGYCEWNSDLNQGDPTFEQKIMNPPSPEACNISLGNLTFNDSPGTYNYGALRIVDKDGIASPIASVTITVNPPPSFWCSDTAASSPYSRYETDANTVGLWHMTESSGDVSDSSGNGNTAIDTGTTNIPAGKYGPARGFDATSDNLKVSNNAALNPQAITLEAWIYPTSETTYGRIISKPWISNNNPWAIYSLHFHDEGTAEKTVIWTVTIGGIIYDVFSPSTIPLNVWTYVVGTYDGETIKLYINGQLVASGTLPSGPIDSNTEPLYIGYNARWTPQSFVGYIDEARISNVARSDAEILAAYKFLVPTGTGHCITGLWCPQGVTCVPDCSSCNNPPSANNLSMSQPNYCIITWPAGIFSWNFTDPDGDTQSAYRIQIDNESSFTAPYTVNYYCALSGGCAGDSNSYATLPSALSWNTTYYWQLKVWDSKDTSSDDWIVYQNNVPPPESFNTPLHAYPVAKYPTLTPLNPAAKETVTFSPPDQPAGVIPAWAWNIPDAIYVGGTNSASKNPQIQFNSAGAHTVSLTVTDAPPHSSYSCSASVTINLQLPPPEWKEIPPF